MRKLNKNFSGQKKTVESMSDSCLNGCSCRVISCPCGWDYDAQYNTWRSYQEQHKNAFKNAAY